MQITRYSTATLAVAILLVVFASPARAQRDFFKSSPGSLSKSHADLDDHSNCNDCHDGGKKVDNDKCLSCHEHRDLRARIRAGEGYHASAKVRRYRCEDCHLEHRGRSFDVMGWDAVGGSVKFDHALAGWKLEGKHASADCKSCHKRHNRQGLRLYLGEERRCAACHGADQPHYFSRQSLIACDRCHTPEGWSSLRRQLDFDHSGGAAPAREGRHAELACAKCHPKARFNLSNDPVTCANCHEDKHPGHLFSTKPCDWCHSPKRKSMADVSFSHRKPRTRHTLTGAHRKSRCVSCHRADLGKRKPSRSCSSASCHRQDSPHRKRFAKLGAAAQCTTCHQTSNWRPTSFSHNKHTRFALLGEHARASCRTCHRGKKRPFSFEKLTVARARCTGCHVHEDVHDGKFRRKSAAAEERECLVCHVGVGQRGLTRAAQDNAHGVTSKWPLTRRHRGVACERCHKQGKFEMRSSECDSCHRDTLHRGTLGKECSRCHMGGDWRAVRFDHEVTKWPLEGWHKHIDGCEKCHPGRRFGDTPTSCGADGCHAADDIHKGQLGDECERCHSPTGENKFEHNQQTHFALRGAHQRTACDQCHSTVRFAPRSRQCVGCHPEPAAHRGRYGKNCAGCHNQNVFSDVTAIHDLGDFSLGGAHDGLDCTACHVDSRPLRGTGELCITCHRQDDVHANGLSPRCGTCHSQWSWAPARFDHSSVGCTPIGLHRTLPCNDCHKNGNYAAVSAQCYSCHRDEALAVTSPDHSAFFDCGRCHNASYWSNGSGTGAAHGRESICW